MFVFRHDILPKTQRKPRSRSKHFISHKKWLAARCMTPNSSTVAYWSVSLLKASAELSGDEKGNQPALPSLRR
jgi:hypothetical protein